MAPGPGTHGEPARQRSGFGKKQRVVALLLGFSPVVQRIGRNGSRQARNELDAAHAAYARAIEEAGAGRFDAAADALDDALRRIVSASHMMAHAAADAVADVVSHAVPHATRIDIN